MAQPYSCSEAESGFLEGIGDISPIGASENRGFREVLGVMPFPVGREVLAGTGIWGPSFDKGQSWM